MENSLILISKEQYALRKTGNEIAITNRILSNIVEKKPKEYFEKGEFYFDRNEFKEAIKWYSLAIAEKENFSIAFCKRAYSNMNIQEFHSAIIDFDKAIQYNPQYNDAYFGRANAKGMGFKDFEGAIEDFNMAIEFEPKDGYAYFFLAKAKEYSGNLKGAIEDLLNAGRYGVKEAGELGTELFSRINEKNYDLYCAIERISNQIDQDRKNSDFYFRRGLAKAELEDYSNAISDFNFAVDRDKSQADYYFYRGLAKDKCRDIDGAIVDYSKAIELKEDFAAAYYNRARKKTDLEDYHGAIDDFKKRIQYKEADKYVYYNTGLCLFNIGNISYNSKKHVEATEVYNESIEYFNKAIDLDRDYGQAYGNRGAAKRMLIYLKDGSTKGNIGEKGGACEDFKIAHELGDGRAMAFMNEYCSDRVENMLGESHKKNITENLEKGDYYYKQGEYKTAIVWCNNALELDSNNAKAYYGIGIAKLALKDYAGTIEALTKSIELDPSFEFSFLNRGDAKLDMQDFPGAIKDYSKAIELNQKLETAYINRGIGKFSLQDYDGAISDFNKVIELNSANLLAYHHRGKTKRYLNDDIGAIKDFTIVIQSDLMNARAYFDRGAARLSLSQNDDARKDLLKAGELGYTRAYDIIHEYLDKVGNSISSTNKSLSDTIEKDSNYYLKSGIEKYDNSDYNGAITDFDEVIRLDENYTRAYYYKGLSYTGLARFEDAIGSLNIAIIKANIPNKLEGNEPTIINSNLHLFDARLVAKIYFQRGYLYSKFKKDYSKANEEYTESIRYYDGDFMAYSNRGKNRDRLKDYEGAIDDYNKAFELGDKSIYYSRGLVQCKMNKFEEAIDDLTNAIELNPTEAVFYYERGIARHSMNSYVEAAKDYQKTIELNPNYVNAHFMMAQLKSQLKDNIGAISDYTMVIKIDPKDGAAYYYRGIENHKLGKLQEAREDMITAGKLGDKRGPEYINKHF